jgi:hypothetical protein
LDGALCFERRQTGMACRFEKDIKNKILIALAAIDGIAGATCSPALRRRRQQCALDRAANYRREIEEGRLLLVLSAEA